MQMCVRDDLNEGSDLLIQHMPKLKLDAVARVTAMALVSCKEPSIRRQMPRKAPFCDPHHSFGTSARTIFEPVGRNRP
jgi:hypothetical protein